MKLLLVSAEAVPFAKVGGLADVVGSLPRALKREGVDARVLLPGYGNISHTRYGITPLFSFKFQHRHGESDVQAYSCEYQGITFYFLQGWPFFGNENSVYTSWEWDTKRFTWFNQASMAFMWELHTRLDWMPDVVNVNDWHTALLPFLIASKRWQSEWSKPATVLTIHNIAYQGNHMGGVLYENGIDARLHHLLDFHGLNDNLLGIGIAYSDMINTVSPRYAQEIQYPYAGYELAGIIRDRRDDLVGILNGLDTELWNPQTDPLIVRQFNRETFATERIHNKRHLQAFASLPVRDEVPVIGMVTRLASQKGFGFTIPALRRLMTESDVQFIVLGTGEPEIEAQMRRLAHDFGWRARVFLEYHGALAQQIYAGVDIFLMPSHFEPCGMGQMIAMRYGALPLVRETGGLADTVMNYDNADGKTGNGFVFSWETPDAVLGTMRWAIDTYRNRPHAWHALQTHAMSADFSWQKSATEYIYLYQRAIQKRKGA